MIARHEQRQRARTIATAIVLVGAAWLALGTGCGGAAAPSAASPTSNASGGQAKATSDAPGYAQPGYPPGPQPGVAPPSATYAPPPPGTSGSSRRIEVTIEYDRAARELEAAMSDCSSACRALASLERATVRLCDLAEQADDVQRCEDAKKKLRSARDRVRTTCTSCPGGPSVDRDAPIPSK